MRLWPHGHIQRPGGEVIVFTTWKWGGKYDASYVNKLAYGVSRNVPFPVGFVCVTTDAAALSLTRVRPLRIHELPSEVERLTTVDDGCYARLFMFSPVFWDLLDELFPGRRVSRVINLDLDGVITGPLDDIMAAPYPFIIGRDLHMLPIYNGSIMSVARGAQQNLWADFTISAAQANAHVMTNAGPTYAGTDQSWIWHKAGPHLPTFGPREGVYGYAKREWPADGSLPANARIVFFPGARDPGQGHIQQRSPWIREHWV